MCSSTLILLFFLFNYSHVCLCYKIKLQILFSSVSYLLRIGFPSLCLILIHMEEFRWVSHLYYKIVFRLVYIYIYAIYWTKKTNSFFFNTNTNWGWEFTKQKLVKFYCCYYLLGVWQIGWKVKRKFLSKVTTILCKLQNLIGVSIIKWSTICLSSGPFWCFFNYSEKYKIASASRNAVALEVAHGFICFLLWDTCTWYSNITLHQFSFIS